MLNKENLLKKFSKIDDRLFISKMLDRALRAEKIRSSVFSDFMDPHHAKLIETAFSEMAEVNYIVDGGYPGAERVIVIFRPDFMSGDSDHEELPIKLVHIALKSRENLNHRDYLGALMGLGIKREKIGDILVREDFCDVLAFEDIAEYIAYNLDKVGNARVEVELRDLEDLHALEPKTREIKTTVASLRLDSVASSGFGISRSKMADYIKAEKVNLNWEVTDNLTKQVKEGDTISIRGKGRVVVHQVSGTTKKGRIGIVLKKLL